MEQHYRDEVLSAYMDGDLEPSRQQEVARHVRDCPVCRRTLDELAGIRDAAAALEQLEPSEQTWFAVRQRILKARRFRRIWFWAGIPAAAAAAVLLIVLFPGRKSAKPTGPVRAADLSGTASEARAHLAAEYEEYRRGIDEALDEIKVAMAENPRNPRVRMAYLAARSSQVRSLDRMCSWGD